MAYIGGRYTLPLAERWSFTLRARDVGGFGIGAESTWHLVSCVNWHASDSVSVSFGYRMLAVDYDDGDGAGRFLYDVEISGPPRRRRLAILSLPRAVARPSDSTIAWWPTCRCPI